MKRVTIVFLSILILFSMNSMVNVAFSETMEELDEEFDSLIEDYKHNQRILDILHNGNYTYPSISDNYDNIMDVELEIPDDVFSYATGKAKAGTIYLVTGKVIEMESYFDWTVDVDGKIIHIWPMCYDEEKIKSGVRFPKVGETANFYITFYHCFMNPVFYLDVTDREIEGALDFS